MDGVGVAGDECRVGLEMVGDLPGGSATALPCVEALGPVVESGGTTMYLAIASRRCTVGMPKTCEPSHLPVTPA
jgi:hypothetical protein